MRNKYLILLSFIIVLADTMMAQTDYLNCGTDKKFWELVAKYPDALIAQQQLDNDTRSAGSQRGPTDVYVIPVVFHIIHNYGAENISDEQVYDAVRIINDDFRKLNSDTGSIVSAFKPIAADAMIEFRLASKDPNGNCTNGIDRIHSLQTYNGDDNAKLNPWPRNYYLNIWVVASMRDGVAGYAYYPGAVEGLRANIDGVMILHDYVGSIGTSSVTNSRALTHEIGHSLNLPHTWGNTNEPGVSCGDDGIQDTPPTAGWTTCNLNGRRCDPTILENVQNYMEYAYCSKMFTLGQRDVMRFALESSVSERSNLWQESNLLFTGTFHGPAVCAPTADFHTVQNMVCVGDQVNFRDDSWGGEIGVYQWTFEGGTPSVSNDTNPIVSFATPGWHNVTLNITANGGTASVTKTNTVYVASATSNYFGYYTENFEDEARYKADFISFNLDPVSESKWEYFNGAGYNGWHSAKLQGFGNIKNDVDELVGPAINLAGLTGPQYLYFHYTNATTAQALSEIKDTLKVFYSIDCGKTWVRLSTLTGLALANDGFHAESYMPYQQHNWKGHVITLPPAALTDNFRFKFQFKTSEKGNNIYVDDINLSSLVGIDGQDVLDASLTVYPNPVQNLLNVKYTLTNGAPVKTAVYDLLGKEVLSLEGGMQNAGDHAIQFSSTNLPNGVYFVKLQVGSQTITEKIVIAK